jgi:hypothetical protein
MDKEEREFIKAAMQGLLSNPEITPVDCFNIDKLAQKAHQIGTATYRRTTDNE